MRVQTSASSPLVVINSMVAGNLTRSGTVMATALRNSAHARHVDEFPRARQRPDRHLNQGRLTGGQNWALSAAPSSAGLRARRPAAPKLSAYCEVRIGQIRGDQPVAEALLLDAPHIAEGAVVEHHGDQRNAVADRCGKLVAGIEEAAVAADREHRRVGPRALRTERGGIAPAEIVLDSRARETCAADKPASQGVRRSRPDSAVAVGWSCGGVPQDSHFRSNRSGITGTER